MISQLTWFAVNLGISLIVFLPVLLGVAYLTVLERKVIGVIQRRISVNIVGLFGLLQPFADALKLLAKENLIPSHANKLIFYAAPVVVLFFSLIGWLVIPLFNQPILSLVDIFISAPYSLAVSSIAVYGILLAGWAANSKYAFLGSMRSTAQLISYELIFSTCVLIVVLLAGSFSYTTIQSEQNVINNIIPLLGLFVIYYISCLAETNRAPFDNVEAESELVAGFFAEHSSVPFVMFFLGEYNALLLISALTAVLFIPSLCDISLLSTLLSSPLGSLLGDLLNSLLSSLTNLFNTLNSQFVNALIGYNLLDHFIYHSPVYDNPTYAGAVYEAFQQIVEGLSFSLTIALVAITFVWVRATLPRFRFDTLLMFCWIKLLPVVVALLLLELSLLISAA